MAKSFKEKVTAFGAQQGLNYLRKNPEENLPNLLNWLDKVGAGKSFPQQFAFVKKVLTDKDNKWYKYAMNVLHNIDPHCLDRFLDCMVINGSLFGLPRQHEVEKENDCNIPWAILFDPTSACNMHCVGCWAADYGHQQNLTYADMDKIVSQGEEIGIYNYIMTGGEPLTRKADIIRLAREHNDAYFLIFTNTTLIDDEFCKQAVEVGNLMFAASIEGSKETTDARRGDGCYDKVMHGLDLLKKYGIPFAVSCCYTSQNYKAITSDEFIKMIEDKGALVAWYFHFMPVGQGAGPELMPNPEQREYVYRRLRYIRSKESPFSIFTIDFQNDGEFVSGCIAGGAEYCHINSHGDVEPCVFIHYSSANIKEMDLLDCLKQPLFLEYRKHQPFNENMLMPCPMLENSGVLSAIVKESGAHSTDLVAKESAEELCAKTKEYAENWKPKAEELWQAEKDAGIARKPKVRKF